MHISWVVLQMWKSSPNGKTTWWLFSWNLRIDNVHICDSTLLPHLQPVRELCMSWLLSLLPLSLTWLLKVLCQNLELAETFQGKKYLFSWHGPAVNLSLLQIPMSQFAWPHCALGTRTWANNIAQCLSFYHEFACSKMSSILLFSKHQSTKYQQVLSSKKTLW